MRPASTRRRNSVIEPNSYVVTVSANVTDAGRADQPDDPVGPGTRRCAGGSAAAALSCRCGSRRRFSRSTATSSAFRQPIWSRRRGTRARTNSQASTRTTSFRSAFKPGTAELEYYPLSIPIRRIRSAGLARLRRLHIRRRSAATGASTRQVLCRTEAFESLRTSRPRSGPRRSGSGCSLFLRAAPVGAQLGERLRRQLRLVHHLADGHHQRGHVPAAAQEQRVDAEDAGDSAAGEEHPGSLREAEDDRSRAPEDEHRADGALPAEGRQPGERLRPDAADVPGAARLLQPVVGGDRAARRAVHLVDSRPRSGRPVLRDADSDGRLAGAAAEDDADDRRRSRAAEDDAVHADHLHVSVSDVARGARALLVREQRARDRSSRY